MINSKFKFWVYLLIITLIGVSGLLLFFISLIITNYAKFPFGGYVFTSLFSLIWLYLIFVELKTKAIIIEIKEDKILYKNYLGKGKTVIFNFNEFDGFQTSILPSRFDEYEFLYLIIKGKKVVKISDFYHRNYTDLKNIISVKSNYLGHEKYSMIREIKEIFN